MLGAPYEESKKHIVVTEVDNRNFLQFLKCCVRRRNE